MNQEMKNRLLRLNTEALVEMIDGICGQMGMDFHFGQDPCDCIDNPIFYVYGGPHVGTFTVLNYDPVIHDKPKHNLDMTKDHKHMQRLNTPESRLEIQDAATCAWHECADCDSVMVRIRHVEQYLCSLGLTVGVSANPGASSPVMFLLTDPNGYALTLEWDAMQDGFSYETEGEDAYEVTYGSTSRESEPETATDAEDDDGIPCDGCGSDDGEPCGEGFAFCSACRAKDAAAAVSEPTDHVGKGALDGLDLEQMRSIVHFLLGYSGLTVYREKDSRTGEERVSAYHDCDGSMSVLAVKPRIDMAPAKAHMVRIEGEYDAICDMLGEAVGRTIDAYEITERGR